MLSAAASAFAAFGVVLVLALVAEWKGPGLRAEVTWPQRAPFLGGGGAETHAWSRFHARYYVVALFFVLFDIEAAFLFPWAIRVRELGTVGFVAIVSFVVVLMLGWAWAQRKGALEWQ